MICRQIGFAVIFSFARMVGGPYLTYMTLSSAVPFLIKVFLTTYSQLIEYQNFE